MFAIGVNGFGEEIIVAEEVWRGVQESIMPRTESVGDAGWGGATGGVVAINCWRGEEKVTEETISVVEVVGDCGMLLDSMLDSRWRLGAGVGKGSDGAKITNVDSFSAAVGSGHDMGGELRGRYGKREGPEM